MGLRQALISQGVEPRGALGRATAWVMPVLFRSLYGKIARLLDLRPEDDVLDVACGSGIFLQRYASHAHSVAGLDHSEIQVGMARQRLRHRIAAGTAEIEQGDSASLPWEEGRFSVVTCNCLGCFAQPLRSVKEMHRVLRLGGRLVLSIDFYPDEQTARRAEQKDGLPTWTGAELRTMLDDVGFAHVCLSHDTTTTFATADKTDRSAPGSGSDGQPRGAVLRNRSSLQGLTGREA